MSSDTESQRTMSTFLLLLLSVVGAVVADNLGTLKTYQRASCNEDWMTLKCPIGTAILVTVARYGRASIDSSGKCSTTDPMITDNHLNSTCLWPNALQHSLLQTVVEVCQKKRQCTFNTSPKMSDPCPDMPKYIEVVYKCRPYEFRSKVACENDAINLSCFPNYRVAIYSASFGRTEYESLQCPQPNGVKDETCLASHATEKVIDLCHGRRHCSIAANSSTFGDPCRPESRTYLKVVYTCVWRSVLREQYEKGDMEPDEENLPSESDEGFDRADFRVEFSPSPNLESPQFQPRDNTSRPSVKSSSEPSSPPRARTNNDVGDRLHNLNAVGDRGKAIRMQERLPAPGNGHMLTDPSTVGNVSNCTTVLYATPVKEDRVLLNYVNEWISAYVFLAYNQEKFYLYVIVSVSAGVLLLLGLVIGRLLLSRHRTKRDAKFHAKEETLPNGFTDDISEIDADIDLTTPVPVPMQDTRLPETQLAERLHGDRYYSDARIPLSPISTHSLGGMRVDLGNHMVGTDSLHTILRPDGSRFGSTKTSYYYG
ncbi:PREDICTED: protein eva-1 isoform X2 [Ceratosolen solmsi marchali]|uniref:Protein eva-1 isoform X2 n=1 Tax=Ceratosolen solmsi marchali TaxID=326594 RepID=A0AAJ6YBN2_9HYME|nr:PREDICTED: protein eva-1 isoform X2 [Ceratosolen solmsi marchali]